jgi:tetratricopeptide (TPR) repeat protein
VLFRRGEHARAIEVLEEAAERVGPDAVVLEHLGDAYRAVSRREDAAGAYRRALGVPGDEGPDETARRRAAVERKLRELSGEAFPPVSLTPPASGR